jgi:hypothetical protein
MNSIDIKVDKNGFRIKVKKEFFSKKKIIIKIFFFLNDQKKSKQILIQT